MYATQKHGLRNNSLTISKWITRLGTCQLPFWDAPNQPSKEEEMQQQRQRQEEFKNQVLNQILDQQARARLSTLSLAKPEKAQAVEGMLINMARMGRIGGENQ
ncbi:Programmed cell death protein 5 [Orchesella cincta]|uniref:Programmed cell death protein 5 n=1 Tax=Orchesella cincta TaxID=48709 RepID=A0A1D2MJA9_ORCCI|nr:Programmed cell death protein 5 [Orchesella cincta]